VQSLQILGGNIEDLRVKGNCRKGQEDVGSMRAIGIKSQADGTMYSESDNPRVFRAVDSVTSKVRPYLRSSNPNTRFVIFRFWE
jgi:hypothetical protein